MPTTQTCVMHSLTSIKPKPYWQLFVREDGKWAPQFGDYERAVVADIQRTAGGYPAADRRDK